MAVRREVDRQRVSEDLAAGGELAQRRVEAHGVIATRADLAWGAFNECDCPARAAGSRQRFAVDHGAAVDERQRLVIALALVGDLYPMRPARAVVDPHSRRSL